MGSEEGRKDLVVYTVFFLLEFGCDFFSFLSLTVCLCVFLSVVPCRNVRLTFDVVLYSLVSLSASS